MTLRQQFILAIVAVTLIPLFLMPVLGYTNISGVMEQQLLTQNEQNLSFIRQNFNQVLNDIISASNSIAGSREVRSILAEDAFSFRQQADGSNVLNSAYASYLYRYDARLTLYGPDRQRHLSTTSEPPDDGGYRQWLFSMADSSAYIEWKAFPRLSGDSAGASAIMAGRNILDINGESMGTLVLSVFPDKKLKALLGCGNEFDRTERYLLDSEGTPMLILAPQEGRSDVSRLLDEARSGRESLTLDGQRYSCSYAQLDRSGWGILQLVPYDAMVAPILRYRNFNVAANLVFFLLIVALAVLISDRLTHALVLLKKAMGRAQTGDFSPIFIGSHNREIRQMEENYNQMVARLDSLFAENQRITQEKERSRLLALQSQIQPHFLLNTLNGVKWLCIIEGAHKAEEMITSLGYILEFSLNRNKGDVTVKKELECLDHYVKIQKMRYGNTFQITYDVSEDTLDVSLPPLFLQPLVENCIVHGFHNLGRSGKIELSVKRKDGWIVIRVRDDGWGIPAETLERLRDGMVNSRGIGVENVRERVRLHYGVDSAFTIESGEEGGAVVTIRFHEGEGRTRT